MVSGAAISDFLGDGMDKSSAQRDGESSGEIEQMRVVRDGHGLE